MVNSHDLHRCQILMIYKLYLLVLPHDWNLSIIFTTFELLVLWCSLLLLIRKTFFHSHYSSVILWLCLAKFLLSSYLFECIIIIQLLIIITNIVLVIIIVYFILLIFIHDSLVQCASLWSATRSVITARRCRCCRWTWSKHEWKMGLEWQWSISFKGYIMIYLFIFGDSLSKIWAIAGKFSHSIVD